MPLLILSVVVQAAFVIHVLKTGRNQYWIWVVMMLPGAGSLAYFVMEVLPDLMAGSGGRQTRNKATSILNPNRDLNAANHDLEVADTVQNNQRLADELMEKGRFSDASELYQKCLTGLNQHNPELMFGYAACQFELGNHAVSRTTLDTLIAENPNYKNQDAHLLYARSLEQQGDVAGATTEYDTLIGYYTGPEPAFRYAMMLKANGNAGRAADLLQGILDKARLSPSHYTKLHKKWINLAKQELRT